MTEKLKGLNVKVPQQTLNDLKFIQAYYGMRTGGNFTQKDALIKLLNETVHLIKKTGETYPGRNWDFDDENIREED